MQFVFLKHGVNHKRNYRTRIIFYQAIIVFINIGNIAEEEVCSLYERIVLLQNKTRFVKHLWCHWLVCLKITNEKMINIILSLTYKPTNDDWQRFEKDSSKILSINEILKKEVIMFGNLNMNLLDFETLLTSQ